MNARIIIKMKKRRFVQKIATAYLNVLGWEPKSNISEEGKKKQFDKHFKRAFELHFIASQLLKFRYPEIEVIISYYKIISVYSTTSYLINITFINS